MKKFRFIVAGVLLIVGLFVQSFPYNVGDGINIAFGTLFIILSLILFKCNKDDEYDKRISKLEDDVRKLKGEF